MTYDIVIFNDHAGALGYVKGLGPYRIASELRAQGYTCKVIDFAGRIMLDIDLFKSICESVIGDNTLWIGWSSNNFSDWEKQLESPNWWQDRLNLFSMYPVPEKKFKFWLLWMKKRWPQAKQVYGGSKALPGANLIDGFDFMLTGLADSMALELTNHLRKNTPLKYRPSLTHKWKIMDHDNLGSNFDYVNSYTKYEDCDHVLPGEILNLETSRGCKFKCKFCSYPLIGRKVTDPGYHRSEQCLADELKHNWEKFGTKQYTIVDDTFNESIEKMEALLRARDKAGIDTLFSCFARIELVQKDRRQLELLKELGVISYHFGVETFNDKAGACIGKGMASEKVKELLYKVNDFYSGKVSIAAGFIVGLPYETPDSIESTIQWLEQPDCPVTSPNLTPLDLNNRSEFKSEFEVNYKKYGYEKTETGWKNAIWTSDEAALVTRSFRDRYHAKTGGGALGMFTLFQVLNLGYTFDDIGFTRFDNLPWDDLTQRQTNYYDRYLQTLLEYEGIKI